MQPKELPMSEEELRLAELVRAALGVAGLPRERPVWDAGSSAGGCQMVQGGY